MDQFPISEKKAVLDALRAAKKSDTASLDYAVDLELTFASNAIEGNTLTQIETSLVIGEGLTIGGKPLKDHLEAVDHFEALGFIREFAKRRASIGEWEVRSFHALVLKRSAPDMAGRYATHARYVNTDRGRHAFPPPAEIPALMATSDAGSLPRWPARTQRSRHISGLSTSIPLQMATGGRLAC